MLHSRTGAEQVVNGPVPDVAALWDVLRDRFPDAARDLDDPIFNVAVNDVMLLHGVRQWPLEDGDVVEIVPAIAGG